MGAGKALSGDNQLYFFSQITQERISPNGYWKHLGVDDPITSASQTVGFKKFLVFYIGEAPVGIKTNWVMHEYHLLDGATTSRSSRRRGKPRIVSFFYFSFIVFVFLKNNTHDWYPFHIAWSWIVMNSSLNLVEHKWVF